MFHQMPHQSRPGGMPATSSFIGRPSARPPSRSSPLTIATCLVNTFTNFVKDIHVHHRPQDSPAGDIRLEPVDNNQNICGQNDLNTPSEGGSHKDFQVRMFVCMYIFAAVCVTTLVCVCLPHCMFSRCYIHPSCLSVGCLYRFG